MSVQRSYERHPFDDDTEEVVGVIVRDIDNKLLIVQGVSGKWSLPKGRRKRGETAYEGALREAYEEAGINLEGGLYVGCRRIGFGTYFEFRVRSYGENLGLKTKQRKEILAVDWKYPGCFWMRRICESNNDLSLFIRTRL